MGNSSIVSGIVERLTQYGVVIGGKELKYSKWFEGARLDDASVGKKVDLTVDSTDKGDWIKSLGAKSQNGFGGGQKGKPFGRMSAEEIQLKKDEGIRIGRSVALDRAILAIEKGIKLDEIAASVKVFEHYIQTGEWTPNGSKAAKPETPKSSSAGSAPATSKPPAQAPATSPKTPAAKKEVPKVETPKSSDASPSPAPAKAPKPEAKDARTKSVNHKKVSDLFGEAAKAGWEWTEFAELAMTSHNAEPFKLTELTFEDFAAQVRAMLKSQAA